MATTSIVRLSDSDIERLAAAMAEKMGVPLWVAEIATRLVVIEEQLAEKNAGRKK